MKKILLSIILLSTSIYISSQITWMGSEYSTLSGTQYLGDDILFEIQSWPMALNQGAQVYIDWSNNGYNGVLNFDYYPLTWISQVGNNSKWNSFVRMKEVGTHNRRYLGWQTGQSDYITANFGEFTVTALSNPTSTTATQNSASQIDLSWGKWNSKNVMVVRKKSTDSWTEPNQGTAYSAGNTIGSGTVIYNGSGMSYQNTGLTSSTSYDYKFYSVNNDYYSAGTTTNASTASLSSDYFRSKVTGNWNLNSTWESSNNNSDWVNSTITPTTTNVAILSSHTVSITENLTISSLTVNSGGIVEVSAAKQLTINTTLTNNGILTLKSADGVGTATIKTPETISGSGTYNVEQYLGTTRNWYISSPIAGAIAPSGFTYHKRYEATASWLPAINVGDALSTGTGYVVLPSNSGSKITFSGTSLNTGNKPVTLSWAGSSSKGFNLIGNPYPSYLEWNTAFYEANQSKVEATIWYRTNSGSSNANGWSFYTFNATSGISVPGNPESTTGLIAPMQAFWVKAKADNQTITFTNTMRSHQDQSVATNRLKAPAGSAQKLARLEIAAGTDIDETVVYFNQNALNTFDDYDSQKMFNETAGSPEIYTFTDSKNLVINGFNDITLNTEIPLGFRTGITTEGQSYTLKATQLLNFDSNVEMVLVDKQNSGSETVMNEGVDFTFTSDAVNTTNRFSLVFRTKGSTTGGCCFGTFENKIRIQKNESNQIVVNCDNAVLKNATIAVYNAAGQKLMQQSVQSSTTVLSTAFKSGVYLVKLQSEGKVYNVKVTI